jgi:hypothetical protein
VVPLVGDSPEINDAKKVAMQKRTDKRKTQWPNDFVLDEAMRNFATARGWEHSRQDVEFEKFRANAEQNGRLLKDWAAGWRTWVLNGICYDQQRGRTPVTAIAPSDPVSTDWDKRVEKFKTSRMWPPVWGPQPGSAGCRAPRDTLDRHGFDGGVAVIDRNAAGQTTPRVEPSRL